VQSVSAGTVTTVRPRLCSTRRDTGGPAKIMRIDRRRIIRSVAKLARTRRSPAAPPARACDANPLAGFGSEASKDQHYVLDAAHTTKGMKAQ
jgi:hypothetical protein